LLNLMNIYLKATKENQKQGKPKVSMFQFSSKRFTCLLLHYYKRWEKEALQMGSSAQASWITTGPITCPHQPFYKKKTFNPKNMMPWNKDNKNKYADMKNDPSWR